MQEAIGNKTAGAAEPFAFITVTYPEGSVCTCDDGVETLAAKNTDGTYVFCVPHEGEWTVTSTDPEDRAKTKSQIVEITEEGQFENVMLSYALMLFDNGIVESMSVADWQTSTATIGDTISYNSNSNSAAPPFCSVLTDAKIDLTHYNTLYINIDNINIRTQYSDVFIIVDSDRSTQVYNYGNLPSGFISVCEANNLGVNSLDISELTGEYYVGIGFGHNLDTNISKVWLE